MKIKHIFLIIAVAVFAQTFYAQNVENSVKQIRSEVAAINKNVAKYGKKVISVDGISLEGTEATYFISGKGLKKITAKMYGETYNASLEIYYSGEEKVFAFMKMNRYDTQIGLDKPPKVVSVIEKRFYFSNGLIKLLVGKTNVKKGSEEWKEAESELADTEQKLREAYESEL